MDCSRGNKASKKGGILLQRHHRYPGERLLFFFCLKDQDDAGIDILNIDPLKML